MGWVDELGYFNTRQSVSLMAWLTKLTLKPDTLWHDVETHGGKSGLRNPFAYRQKKWNFFFQEKKKFSKRTPHPTLYNPTPPHPTPLFTTLPHPTPPHPTPLFTTTQHWPEMTA